MENFPLSSPESSPETGKDKKSGRQGGFEYGVEEAAAHHESLKEDKDDEKKPEHKKAADLLIKQIEASDDAADEPEAEITPVDTEQLSPAEMPVTEAQETPDIEVPEVTPAEASPAEADPAGQPEAIPEETVTEVEPEPGAAGGGGEDEPPEPPEAAPEAAEPPEPDPPEAAPSAPPPPPRPTPPPIPPRYRSTTYPPPYSPAPPGAVDPTLVGPTPSDPTDNDHEREVREAALSGQRYGMRRGLVTGLVTGWYIERRHRKRVEKRHAKEIKEYDKRLDTLEKGATLSQQELAAQRAAAVERLKELDHTKKVVEELSNQSMEAPTERDAAEFAALRAEHLRNDPERPPQVLAPEDLPIEAPTKLRDDRRLETSIWHRIEVEKGSGAAAGQPEVPYGEEFDRERAAEIKRQDIGQDNGGGAGGGMAGSPSAAAFGPNGQSGTPGTPGYPAQPGQPTQAAPTGKPTPGKQVIDIAKNPIIWAVVIAIVLVLFVFGMLR